MTEQTSSHTTTISGPGMDAGQSAGVELGRGPRRDLRSAALKLAQRIVLGVLYAAVVVALWALLIKVLNAPSYIYPSPKAVGKFIVDYPGTMWTATKATVKEIILGFLGGLLAGVLLAFICDGVRMVRTVLWPLIVFFQMVPKIALAPWFLLIFGLGEMPKIVLVGSLSFFPIFIEALAGFEGASEGAAELSKALRMSPVQSYLYIKLPGALPRVLSGAQVAMSLAIVGAVVAEFISANQGLGYLIVQAQGGSNGAALVASVIVLTVVGYILFLALVALERVAIPWHVSQRSGQA